MFQKTVYDQNEPIEFPPKSGQNLPPHSHRTERKTLAIARSVTPAKQNPTHTKNVISSSSSFRGCSFSCAERGSFWGSNDRSNLARYSRLHCTRSLGLGQGLDGRGGVKPFRKNCQPRRNLFSWLPREDGSLGHDPGKNVLLRKFLGNHFFFLAMRITKISYGFSNSNFLNCIAKSKS